MGTISTDALPPPTFSFVVEEVGAP